MKLTTQKRLYIRIPNRPRIAYVIFFFAPQILLPPSSIRVRNSWYGSVPNSVGPTEKVSVTIYPVFSNFLYLISSKTFSQYVIDICSNNCLPESHTTTFDRFIICMNCYHNHNDNKDEYPRFNGTSTKPTRCIQAITRKGGACHFTN